MMQINTVAAGGGSILSFKEVSSKLDQKVPELYPVPHLTEEMPLTVTDCNVLLGKLNPDYFPKVFGKNSNEPLNIKIVKAKFYHC